MVIFLALIRGFFICWEWPQARSVQDESGRPSPDTFGRDRRERICGGRRVGAAMGRVPGGEVSVLALQIAAVWAGQEAGSVQRAPRSLGGSCGLRLAQAGMLDMIGMGFQALLDPWLLNFSVPSMISIHRLLPPFC